MGASDAAAESDRFALLYVQGGPGVSLLLLFVFLGTCPVQLPVLILKFLSLFMHLQPCIEWLIFSQ